MKQAGLFSTSWFAAGVVLCVTASSATAAGVVLRGAGATFPAPIYVEWAAQYLRETGVEVRYAPVGSDAGIAQLEQRLVDFGGSDVPLAPAARRLAGVIEFPAVIGGVVPVVNITGIKSGALKLTGQVLADIYLGRIRRWDDPAIAAVNPEIDLPGSNITVVHRAEASGTTRLWADFLSRSSPAWQAAVGDADVLAWPVGEAATGNDGVAATVQRTRMSIGYVEYAYAKQRNLGLVSLRNHDGRFVAPGATTFAAAVGTARWQSVDDLDRQLPIDAPGAASWPITGASFVMLPTDPSQAAASAEVVKFFDWALHRGRQLSADTGYVPLPADAVERVGQLWDERLRRDAGRNAMTPPASGAAR